MLGQARGPNLWHSAGKLGAFLSPTSLGKMCGSRGTSRDAAEGRDGSSVNMENDSVASLAWK